MASDPAEANGAAFVRLLRLWVAALATLALLGWCSARQPFYRPALSGAGLVVLAAAVWWSVHASARRGDRRRRRSRRREQRRRE